MKWTNADALITNCKSFNQSLDNWETGRVRVMDSTFYGCSVFNQPLNSWNMGNIEDMMRMYIVQSTIR